MIPRSWMIIGAGLAVAGVYGYAHHAGYVEREQEMQLAIAAKNEEAQAREHKLNEQITQTSTELKEANDAVTQKQSALDRAIGAGRVRLPYASCVQAAGGSTAAASSRAEGQTESDRETLRLIAEIAADGDRAINQLNACIDAYNQVKEQVNAQR